MTGSLTRPVFLLVLALAGVPGAPQPADPGAVRMVLRTRIPASGAAPRLVLEGQAFKASPDLACFYQRRDFVPAWSEANALRARVDELPAALAAAPADGLQPEA